jgi:predicted naringenin-chalcone synthase
MVTGPRAAALTGWGTAFPPHLSQIDLWDGYFDARIGGVRGAHLMFTTSGVTTRHAVANPLVEDLSEWSTAQRMDRYVAEALPLGKEAVAHALEDAGLAADEVGLLVTVSCTGYATPGLDIQIAESFAMAPTLERLNVGHVGCHGAFPALGAAARYVATVGMPAVVLSVELASLHVQPPSDDLEQAVVHALFSDAAAAVVLEPTPAGRGLAVVDSGTLTSTTSADLMTWRITDRGFRMTLSRSVADAVAPRAAELVDTLLGRNGLGPTDVARWAIHPGGPKILDRVASGVGLAPEQVATSRAVLAEHGNCSSATILVILDAIGAEDLPSGSHVMALGFGPGLTVAGVLLRQQ